MTVTTVVPFAGSATAADGSTIAISGEATHTSTPVAPAPVPTAKPVFGFNDKVDTGLTGVASTLHCKAITGSKMFNTGMPSSFPKLPTPEVTHPLFCFKPSIPMTSSDKAAIAALAKSAASAAPHAMLTSYQEGEHDGFTIAQIKADHAECYALVKAAAPSVLYGQCLMSFDARPAGNGALAQWAAVQANGKPLDFYGFDTYPWSTTVLPGSVLDACLAQLKTVVANPMIAITECNATSNIATASIQAGAPWFAGCWEWALAHSALMFYGFAQTSRGVPWPPDAATIAELSTIAHASGL